MQIYSQFMLIDRKGQRAKKQREYDVLMIGERARIQLIPYRMENRLKISYASLYRDFNNMPIPSWIEINQDQFSVYVQGNKNGLDSEQDSTINIVLVHIVKHLSSSDFLDADIPIDEV